MMKKIVENLMKMWKTFWIIKKNKLLDNMKKLEIRRLEDFQLKIWKRECRKLWMSMQVEYRQIISLTRNN